MGKRERQTETEIEETKTVFAWHLVAQAHGLEVFRLNKGKLEKPTKNHTSLPKVIVAAGRKKIRILE